MNNISDNVISLQSHISKHQQYKINAEINQNKQKSADNATQKVSIDSKLNHTTNKIQSSEQAQLVLAKFKAAISQPQSSAQAVLANGLVNEQFLRVLD